MSIAKHEQDFENIITVAKQPLPGIKILLSQRKFEFCCLATVAMVFKSNTKELQTLLMSHKLISKIIMLVHLTQVLTMAVMVSCGRRDVVLT